MSDPKQALYDILGDAFLAGQLHAQDKELLASDSLFPLAARMEAEIAKLHSWQPIETAPQDGTWLLVWESDVGQYIYRMGPGLIPGEEPDPTHWMPLPSSPEREI